MSRPPLLVVVLAAGQGTRMKSALPKVLHKVAGRSMLGHVLALAESVEPQSIAMVIGPDADMDAVRSEALKLVPSAQIFVQQERRGTADAVLAARQAIAAHQGDVVVLYADTPLIPPQTLARLLARLDSTAVAVLGFEAADPTGYGRLILEPGEIVAAIREEREASEAERAIRMCNSGVMGFRVDDLAGLLGRIGNSNAKGEFYLTDAIELGRQQGLSSGVVVCEEDEVLGVNSREQLAAAEAIFQRRARTQAMRDGATLIAPETVWLSYDTQIGRDVIIEPNVFFGPGVTVEDGVEIKANCHFEQAHIGKAVKIGPFSRLRPGAVLGEDAHIGNFVEVKNVTLGAGAKANHLSYLGDGTVGAGANIGAGTIFCNYDGFFKHKTEIGAKAFVGSNTSLVAPVKIGDGAYIGSGSVITKDVASGSLALERSGQEERPGWAEKFRTMMLRRKSKAG
ncbi:bifunctional UDP-N-acetylglucosamine diphosphorylase/glucosamine-1-phosphate N-acetyltransferase GlmU [Hyphomicrobium sp. D-2]|uniref:bifunctional UDP-N-acetylglucosamine diphosphorylase/glucosamine-1-phosphate N-acetyltransferase GlmU n=1 Tax=Hyphomicrobium sp. D-2 TaxID=3041621 RepID=UPI002457C89C|nr:bifunctional UDP-N-acetylglucosamine diphosphorylase/glucosamine-1-phosphate N-acetyltransferase GlmU [Hyphomicrobium sp. D-2]MDH4981724.1 bifunctional UDP-N-acetylglucosamine diphosphorylase/glucosamine-1-phosphate N-acetyltransferase GlmU [Hyphomicrobium sp. D-2]